MIKAIIFDFGNVICSVDRTPFFNTLAGFSDKPITEIKSIIQGSDSLRYNSTLLADCESGRISSEEFYRKMNLPALKGGVSFQRLLLESFPV